MTSRHAFHNTGEENPPPTMFMWYQCSGIRRLSVGRANTVRFRYIGVFFLRLSHERQSIAGVSFVSANLTELMECLSNFAP